MVPIRYRDAYCRCPHEHRPVRFVESVRMAAQAKAIGREAKITVQPDAEWYLSCILNTLSPGALWHPKTSEKLGLQSRSCRESRLEEAERDLTKSYSDDPEVRRERKESGLCVCGESAVGLEPASSPKSTITPQKKVAQQCCSGRSGTAVTAFKTRRTRRGESNPHIEVNAKAMTLTWFSCSDAPSLESLPVRLFRRSETRMPVRAAPGPALSAENFRTVARSHRSAHRGSGRGISRYFEHQPSLRYGSAGQPSLRYGSAGPGGGRFRGDSRSRGTRARAAAGALSFRQEGQLQRADGSAPDHKQHRLMFRNQPSHKCRSGCSYGALSPLRPDPPSPGYGAAG